MSSQVTSFPLSLRLPPGTESFKSPTQITYANKPPSSLLTAAFYDLFPLLHILLAELPPASALTSATCATWFVLLIVVTPFPLLLRVIVVLP